MPKLTTTKKITSAPCSSSATTTNNSQIQIAHIQTHQYQQLLKIQKQSQPSQKQKINFLEIYGLSYNKIKILSEQENLLHSVLITTWLHRHLQRREELREHSKQRERRHEIRQWQHERRKLEAQLSFEIAEEERRKARELVIKGTGFGYFEECDNEESNDDDDDDDDESD
ncbi:hypothetical protein G9A89_020109 [Geosiphon pyriformis]|nr:hypothetical protein G9A89_020109 [Geosiphon pyriformis]